MINRRKQVFAKSRNSSQHGNSNKIYPTSPSKLDSPFLKSNSIEPIPQTIESSDESCSPDRKELVIRLPSIPRGPSHFEEIYRSGRRNEPVQSSRSTVKESKRVSNEGSISKPVGRDQKLKKKQKIAEKRVSVPTRVEEQQINKTSTIADQRQSIHFSIIEPSLDYLNAHSSAHTTSSFFSRDMQPKMVQRPTQLAKPQILIGGGNYPINLNSISLLTEKHADLEKKEIELGEQLNEKPAFYSQQNWRKEPSPPQIKKQEGKEESANKLQNAKIKERLEQIKKKEQILRSQTANININININNFGPTYPPIYENPIKLRKYSPASHSNPFKHFRIKKVFPLRSMSDRNIIQFNTQSRQKLESNTESNKAPLARINLNGELGSNFPQIQSKHSTQPIQVGKLGGGSPAESIIEQAPLFEKLVDSSVFSPEREYFSQFQNSEVLEMNRRYFQNRLYMATNKKLRNVADQQKEGIKRKKLKKKELKVHTPTPKNTKRMTLDEALRLKKKPNRSVYEQKNRRKVGMLREMAKQKGVSEEGQIEVLCKNSMMTDYQEYIRSRSHSRSSFGYSEFSHNYGDQLSHRGVVFSGDGENSRRKSSRYYL